MSLTINSNIRSQLISKKCVYYWKSVIRGVDPVRALAGLWLCIMPAHYVKMAPNHKHLRMQDLAP